MTLRKYNHHATLILSKLQRNTTNGEKNFTRQADQPNTGENFITYPII